AFAADPARDEAAARAGLEAQMRKSGDTIFEVRGFALSAGLPFTPFVPASAANRLRREALAALELELLRSFERPGRLPELPPPPQAAPPGELGWRANVTNARAQAFWRRRGVIRIEPSPEVKSAAGAGIPAAARSPELELMRCRHCVRHLLGLCPRSVKGDPQAKEAFKAANGGHLKPEPLLLVTGRGQRLEARFDCKACEMTVHEAGPWEGALAAGGARP
ncbi:MAG: DUF3656 domain-containing protein, partial [Duodenibacillus sp.]|nr:DUF3656 domain-containing protein [Duodenibacillus sp.]